MVPRTWRGSALPSGTSIALATHDVYQYLNNPGLRDEIESGIRMFAACEKRYGTDIWADIVPILSLNDTEFPAYALE